MPDAFLFYKKIRLEQRKEAKMETGYREMGEELAVKVGGEAWNIECMEGHGASGRPLTYIGSMESVELCGGRLVHDYYRDSEGVYWYGDRVRLPDGGLVRMEEFIFGRKPVGRKRLAHRRGR
mgnify:CR=1 FL=1